jgi:hypothetical protein
MATSEDESSNTIDFRPEVAVNWYRLTDCTPPLYIIQTALPYCNNLEGRNGRWYL